MPRVRDLLYRFRPAGAPGPASAAAVPADRVAHRTSELAPVFALLAETEERCADLREEVGREAEATRAQSRETARRLVVGAESRAAADRADAAAVVAARAAGESAAMVRAAEVEAEHLLTRATERTPALVADVVTAVDALLVDAPQGSTP